jgi:hypothetical protein
MTHFTKALMFTAGAATLVATTPLEARHRDYDGYGRGYNRGGDGISAGDVIAGALIIGGIAAIASAGSNDNRYGDYRDRDGYRSYGRSFNGDYGYGSRRAVDQCVNAARRDASRYGWARVTDITSIDRIGGGYEIRGRLVVETRGRGRDYGYDYDRYDDGYDKGRFTCVTRYGRVDDLRLKGLRGGNW